MADDADLREITPDRLRTTLTLHDRWVRSEGGGSEAYLSGHDLRPHRETLGRQHSPNVDRIKLRGADLLGFNPKNRAETLEIADTIANGD